MAAPATTNEFLDLVRKSGVVDDKRLDAHIEKLRGAGLLPPEPAKVAGVLVRDGFLTRFQAEEIMKGKWRRFTIGKYKVLEKIGSGGMGQVYLCEHKLMRRRVAVKVLPTAKAADDSARDRFYREARAVAALDHPNIVHAYDIDQDGDLHFLVMEYVDGANLQEIVKKSGPLEWHRACHYVRQAALGLEHAHQQARLVHRDIKPGNILVDRSGVVKILDMGLARFFNDEEDVLTKKYDESVLGTADYLAPEQALDSHGVDIRADIYSLGATFHYMLTGKPIFDEGSVAQKLIWQQTRKPKALAEFRKDIPPGLQDILDKMLAKDPAQRYSLPAEVADALLPFTETPIGPPPESEMPRWSPAAAGSGMQEIANSTSVTKAPSSGPRLNSKPGLSATPAPRSAPPSNHPPSKTVPTPPSSGRMAGSPPAGPLPKPAPAFPQMVLAPSRPAEEDEENAAWESFVHDTANPNAKDDTAPQSVRSARRSAKGEERARRKERRRLWSVVIVLSLLLLSTVALLLWKFVLSEPGRPNASSGRAPLSVSKDGSKRYRSVRQALQAAQSGDVIEIHDAVHEENLVIDQRAADVTLKAAPGLTVHWIPASKDEKTALIHISKAHGFRLKGKGITLDGMIDGKRRVQDLIFISLYCPGLDVEDLQFVNIGRSAVTVMNAQGTAGQPIRLMNLAVADNSGQKNTVGFSFDASPDTSPPYNDYIEMNEFKGVSTPFKTKDNTVLGKNVVRPK